MLYFVTSTIVGIALAFVIFAMAFNGNTNFAVPLLAEGILISAITALSGDRNKHSTLTICTPAILMCLLFGGLLSIGGSNPLNREWLWLAAAIFMVWLIASFIGSRVRNVLTILLAK
ncbi:hypothetical protein [Sulfuriflexus mobilis]|uniref:hypothetical protein n=1 Tax=Sulfuriflexus mobilis TaxID=1811807 RepID=UPI000F84C732|nr:hypothetical protein [Sulfuriflexus mobilis]